MDDTANVASTLSYTPEWRASSNAKWQTLTFPLTSASLIAAGMKSGTTYQFQLVSVTGPPDPPTNLKISSVTEHSLELSWTASAGLVDAA